MSELNLKGKVHIEGKIKTITGLAIGGAGGALEIGGVDRPVIRNPLNNEPYIPGSSLKGKFRSLLEKYLGKQLNNEVISGKNPIRIHSCINEQEYVECPICIIFGSSVESKEKKKINKPTRLIVRDSFLVDGAEFSKKVLEEKGDLPYSELKAETIIDRITAQAMPRDIERVPAGAEFALDLIFDLYNDKDVEFLKYVFEAMKLLEDDYLGGSGTRGSGQVRFVDISVDIKEEEYYNTGFYKAEFKRINKDAKTTEEILKNFDQIRNSLKQLME